MAPGAFFVLAFVVAIMNKIKTKKKMPIKDMCRDEGCISCTNMSCAGKQLAMQKEINKEEEA